MLPAAPFIIAGPTGSGKSAVAVELALLCGGEIVNADAFQIYTGLDILTAKPSPELLASVPHHLFSTIPAGEPLDVAAYEPIARTCISEIASRGRLPVVVGGSGLYLKTLTHGLSPLPPVDPELRERIAELPLTIQVAWLQHVDPEGAAIINHKNPRYISRALEITLMAGRPASGLRRAWSQPPTQPVRGVTITRERAHLYARIDRRVEEMIAGGAVGEVRASPGRSSTASRAIGYKELRDHLEGKLTLEEATATIQQATRRYAKRQTTWFNREKELQTVCLDDSDDARSAAEKILTLFPELKPPT